MGITRASMRSSKSLKKEFKNSKAIQDLQPGSHSGSVSLFGLSKSKLFKGEKSTNTQAYSFKDSVKLKRVSIKAQLNSKVVSTKNQSNKSALQRNKENDANRVLNAQAKFDSETRRPFLNLEKQPFQDISKNFKQSSGKMARVPFGNLTVSNYEDLEPEQPDEVQAAGSEDPTKKLSYSEGICMEIEIKASNNGVEQLYGDIMAYIMSKQARNEPQNYFNKSQFPARIRAVYTNWLLKMHQKFDLADKTYFLAINIFDRFVQKTLPKQEELRIVICASLLIASKYEEILFNELRDYQIMSNYEFTTKSLLEKEGTILNELDFRIFQTCHMSMIEIIKQHYQLDSNFEHLVVYLLKLCSVNSLLCFEDSVDLTVSACKFIMNQSYTWVNCEELDAYLARKNKDLFDQLNNAVLENCNNDKCCLRRKILDTYAETSLLDLEKMLMANNY